MKTVLSSQVAADIAAWTVIGIWALGAVLLMGLVVWGALEAWFKAVKNFYSAAKITRYIREGLARDRVAASELQKGGQHGE